MYDNTRVTPTRRDEHVADTRQALVDAARTLFTEQGFAATGTEEIVAAARVTRGALYHHFHDKTDLFRAVMEQIAREVAEHLIDAELSRPPSPGPSPADAWGEVRDGLRAFLDLCVVTDDFQRIVLVEGPAVLGHEAWDELVARHGSNLLAEWLFRAVEQGRIAPLPIQPLTRLLIAMISESSLYIARAGDRSAARAAMGTVLDRFLNGLEPSPGVSLSRSRGYETEVLRIQPALPVKDGIRGICPQFRVLLPPKLQTNLSCREPRPNLRRLFPVTVVGAPQSAERNVSLP
jgi:AcrR family transcriptional regulator